MRALTVNPSGAAAPASVPQLNHVMQGALGACSNNAQHIPPVQLRKTIWEKHVIYMQRVNFLVM